MDDVGLLLNFVEKSHDASHLGKLSTEMKRWAKDVAQKYTTVEALLVKNALADRNNYITNVHGAAVMTVMKSKKHQLEILLVGELHGKTRANKPCRDADTVAVYLEQCIESCPKMVDVYLEIGHKNIDSQRRAIDDSFVGELHLKLIRGEFDNCRTHLVDFRKALETDHNIARITEGMVADIVVGKMTKLIPVTHFAYWTIDAIKHPSIQKQLKRIKDRSVANKITKYCTDKIEEIAYGKYSNYLERATAIFNIEGFLMDAYFLGRLFKTPRDSNTKAHHAIVYTGIEHTKRYIEFLRGLGFTDGTVYEESSNKCIQLPSDYLI